MMPSSYSMDTDFLRPSSVMLFGFTMLSYSVWRGRESVQTVPAFDTSDSLSGVSLESIW